MKRYFAIIALLLAAATAAQAQDWANFGRFSESNKAVTSKPKAVLMGDSITEGWAANDPDFFTANNFVGRGISGQCTSQMLVRFRRDVIDLSPKYVVILAGINDIAFNNGSAGSVENIFGNIVSMCELARANRIRPILCTTTPANTIPWRNDVENVAPRVKELNALIREYARRQKIKLVEYYAPLADEDGGFPQEYSYDGIHPTLEGYVAMEKILLGAF